jgi:hypothetical protein
MNMVNRKDKAMIQLHVNHDFRDRVKTQSSIEGRSIKALIIEAVEQYLENKNNTKEDN